MGRSFETLLLQVGANPGLDGYYVSEQCLILFAAEECAFDLFSFKRTSYLPGYDIGPYGKMVKIGEVEEFEYSSETRKLTGIIEITDSQLSDRLIYWYEHDMLEYPRVYIDINGMAHVEGNIVRRLFKITNGIVRCQPAISQQERSQKLHSIIARYE